MTNKPNDGKGKKQKTLDVMVQEQLQERAGFYGRIEELGLSYQAKGQNLVRFARMGQQYTQYQLTEAPKLNRAGSEFPFFNDTLSNWHNYGFLINSYLNNSIIDLEKGNAFVNNAIYGISTATASGSAIIDATTTDIYLLQMNNEKIDFYEKYEFQVSTPLNREHMISQLDGELALIDKTLPQRRLASWEVFNSPTKDNKLQAASSMRQILRGLISRWSSNAEIENTGWWKKKKETKDKITFKDRLRFLLFGPKEIIDETLLNQIDEQINKINKSHDTLEQIAHGSDKPTEFVESTMKLIEDTIFSILVTRKFNLGHY